MSERFFVDKPIQGNRATVEGPEAHHLAHVMRIAEGESVALFDGSGDEFTAKVHRIGKSHVELEILERRAGDPQSPVSLTIAVALPKGERQRWLIEKLVELGAARLVPLITERGVAQPTEPALARLRRAVIEACKQCGRNHLLEIAPPAAWDDYARGSSGSRRLLAHPGGGLLPIAWPKDDQPVVAAIGPEGGFTDAEVQAALAAGWQPVDLGPCVLRVETAAIAVAAWAALNAHLR